MFHNILNNNNKEKKLLENIDLVLICGFFLFLGIGRDGNASESEVFRAQARRSDMRDTPSPRE